MEGESTVEQSAVLTEGEVEQVTSTDTPTEEVATLPSDEVAFEVPEKFKGKSVEDVIKSYQELEKFKGGDQPSTEGEEPSTEPKAVEQEQYDKYATSLDDNGSLSDAEYAELAEAGYDKAAVDAEITRRNEAKEFQEYKSNKALDIVLEPLGGGKDKFKQVAEWANQAKTAEEVQEFNTTLASVPKVAQQAMLKTLYAEYDAAGETPSGPLHTNTSSPTPSKGYSTQQEFFKDIGSEEYKTNPAYRAKVESKMSISDIF